jgi:tripartite-type tricarboxylate transporter receptor subunit TctC
VPYKGTVQAVGDLAVGQVQVVFSDMVPAIPHIRGGRVRALAVTTAKRQAVLPDVPTMIEAGVPDFVADQWWALLVPRATPPEIVERLNAEVARVMRLPDVVERYQSLGMNPAHSTPQHVIELIRTETPEKAKLLKAAGVEPE